MNNLHRLSRLEKPLRVGLIGVGSMGKGLLFQMSQTPGIQCVAIHDFNNDRCIQAAEEFHLPYRSIRKNSELNDALKDKKLAICEEPDPILDCEQIDIFIEATSAIIEGCEYAIRAINNGKHVVLMNSEIDHIFGPYLLHLAKQNNVQITSCDGDQHVVLKHLIDDLKLWGFELIMAGNIKGFLDRYANPESIVEEADIRNLDYNMCTAYTDGTKLNIEMSLIANACNLRPSTVGMTGPAASELEEIPKLFDLEKLRQQELPAIDYVVGSKPHGGVFIVGYSDNSYQRDMMKYYKMGSGPYYIFYRPYHLCHIESIDSIVSLSLDQTPYLVPEYGFKTQVYSYAKTDLHPGDVLDGVGGYKAYGMVDTFSPNNKGIPICLSHGVRVKAPIKKDQPISMDHLEIPKPRKDFELYDLALKYGS